MVASVAVPPEPDTKRRYKEDGFDGWTATKDPTCCPTCGHSPPATSKFVQVQLKPPTKSVTVHATPLTRSVGCQTGISGVAFEFTPVRASSPCYSEENSYSLVDEAEETAMEEEQYDPADISWAPSSVEDGWWSLSNSDENGSEKT